MGFILAKFHKNKQSYSYLFFIQFNSTRLEILSRPKAPKIFHELRSNSEELKGFQRNPKELKKDYNYSSPRLTNRFQRNPRYSKRILTAQVLGQPMDSKGFQKIPIDSKRF